MNLVFQDRRVLVVGGGAVATRRVKQLLDVDARVTVVAPDASLELVDLAANGKIEWHHRGFSPDDIAQVWLVVTATGVDAVDNQVAQLAEDNCTWCMNSANATGSTALPMTTVLGDDGVAIAVSGGSDPGRARAVRDAVGLLLHAGELPTRRTRILSKDQPATGSVTLVGAGPGDPALLTIAAMRAVSAADVLVVDRLAPAVLWQSPAPGVEVIDVGKIPGKHAVPQEEINAILVEKAQAGHRVARIKGGDPFVLGRGGEEALACLSAGVAIDVIPGITSAISVPAAAGIPVTQRGVTAAFVVASAHDGPEAVIRATADAPNDATLVLLMGVGRLPAIAAGLIDSGRAPDTPLAIVESGWTPRQRTTVTTLDEVRQGGVSVAPPAVVVIGEVVRLRESLGDLATPSPDARHA
ncbi:MAG: uroporphyrinogen-III C-methyltransferase [Actinobacteria bacterium]|nr:uroporphyrinogen-III C-methyltransferase [Actinomycetota bacterium]